MDYNININDEDLKLVAGALQELPYRICAPLLQKLQEQVNAQISIGTKPAIKTSIAKKK